MAVAVSEGPIQGEGSLVQRPPPKAALSAASQPISSLLSYPALPIPRTRQMSFLDGLSLGF